MSQQLNVDSLVTELSKAKEDTNKVILYRMLAGTFRLTDPGKAIDYGKAGIVLGKKLGFDKGVAGCYLNVSACYGSAGKLDTSLSFIDTAIHYSHKVGEPNRLALAYLNRADIYRQLQYFTQSLKDCDTSLKYAEQVNSDDRRARVYQTIGSVYYHQDMYVQSSEYYNKAIALYRKFGNLQMSAIVLNNLGNIYKHTGSYQQAIENFTTAINIADSLKDLNNLAMYHGNLSDVYLSSGNYTTAEKYAGFAMQYAQQQNNEKQIAIAWEHFGKAYMKQKRIPEAIQAITKGFEIFQKLGDNDRINTAAEMLAEAYSLSGNYSKAYEFQKISRQVNDTLVKQRYDEDIAAMQTRFKVDEKDKEIQLLAKDKQLQDEKIKQQRFMLTASGAIAILALLGIGLLVSRYRLRNRMKELELRTRIAADLHDEVGSSLSSIHMLSQIAAKQTGSDATHKDVLERMSTNAKETMDKMGDIVWMIKPGESEAGSLKQRMERFIYEMCSSKNIEASVDLDELEKWKLTMEQRKNIYLIFKEAVNNAVKYSGTEKIEVKAGTHNKELTLLVKDQGKGFDPDATAGGNGLDNMKNRAQELNGRLKITSETGKGASIELAVPL
ncbi:MAG TPA: sensor histidine kinase [Chitinophagaceae bacterium]